MCTTIGAAPGDEIWVVLIVTRNWVLLMTVVGKAAPFHRTIQSEQKWLPLTVNGKPRCT